MAIQCRILTDGDEARLEAFLRPRLATSMFLLSNCREAGLVDRGQRRQATYAAAFDGDAMIGIVAHAWNGMLLPQAPDHLKQLAQLAVDTSGRAVKGTVGPAEQSDRLLELFGLVSGESLPQIDEREGLYALDLSDLRKPPPPADGVDVRLLEAGDRDAFVALEMAYRVEALGDPDTPQTLKSVEDEFADRLPRGNLWVVIEHGRLVAYSTFNAELPEAVQVGGVFTSPPARSRGHARRAVAASLIHKRRQGARKAILFTGERNAPAIAAYTALGFKRIGDFRLYMLPDEPRPEGDG